MSALITLALLAACGNEPDPSPPESRASTESPAETSTAARAEPKAETKPEPKAEPKAEPASAGGDAAAGEAVYSQYCTACHQADGTGMNGVLAANFVADKSRLAKSDEELLTSIRDGITGTVGSMPPWGGTLSEEDMKNVLAYIRATYGG